MRKARLWAIVGALCVLAALFIPVTQHRVISYGVDAYTAHKPLFSNHTYKEDITTQAETTGLGIIAVDLYRKKQLADIHVDILRAHTDTVLFSSVIPKATIHDDVFTYAQFKNQSIPKHTAVTIRLSAPEATIKNPIGLRFTPNDNTFALALKERVPAWKAIVTIGNNRKEQWQLVLAAAALSALIAIPAWMKSKKILFWGIALALVCILSYTFMIKTLSQFGGVSGGDAYNYLAITQTISNAENPFINTKRLPGYPLLLVPTYISGALDDQFVMRIFSATAGIWGIIMTFCIARALQLSLPVALVSSAILALQKDYFWTALRPEPYALYTALLLTSVYLFIRSYQEASSWRYVAFGLLLGYCAMTRQEGFVLAAVLGSVSVLYEAYQVIRKNDILSTNMKRFVMMYTPALLLVLPFFISNQINYGSPFYVQYLEGDRLQIVDSFLAFQDALGATWGIIGSMWKTSWDQLERLHILSPIVIVSTIGLWAWYILRRFFLNRITKKIITVILPIIWLTVVISSVYFKSMTIGIITSTAAGFVIASIPIFIAETGFIGIALVLVLVSQVLIATWFHPFTKHYEQSYPLIVLMIGTALVSRLPKKGALAGASIMVSVLPFFLIAAFLVPKLNTAIDKQNEDTALDSVTYRAARYARTLPGTIGFDQAYLPARLYFDPNVKYFPDEDVPTEAMEANWLAQNPVKTLIVSNGNNVFKIPDPNWKILKTFKAAGHDEKIFIGTVYDTGN